MNTWAPLFSKIVESSIWAEEDYVCKLFITMLALKDADQVVRHNAYSLARKCWPSDKKGEERALAALKILAKPDTKRIEPQPHEGRRIERVDGGWLILNGQYYEDMMRTLNRRAYKAKKQAEYRQRDGKKLPGEGAYLRAQREGASQADGDRIVTSHLPDRKHQQRKEKDQT